MTEVTPTVFRSFFIATTEASRPREMIERACDACGATYQLRVKDFNRRRKLTCSAKCMRLKRPQTGEGNPNWKGGVSKFHYRYALRQKAKSPLKVAARRALRSAVRSGLITRQPCKVCGSTEKVHGHHRDYSLALCVVWLCPMHHRIAHGATK